MKIKFAFKDKILWGNILKTGVEVFINQILSKMINERLFSFV